ncbi:MAG: hypothetical protein ABEK10_03080 [Candidatus Nanosalina sp.]
MGLFGSDEEEKEEVTLGLSEKENKEESSSEPETSPEVGAVNFDGKEDSSEEESGNLRNEVSKLDSVRESSTGNTSDQETDDLEEIRRQNEKIIEKLDTVLSRL